MRPTKTLASREKEEAVQDGTVGQERPILAEVEQTPWYF